MVLSGWDPRALLPSSAPRDAWLGGGRGDMQKLSATTPYRPPGGDLQTGSV